MLVIMINIMERNGTSMEECLKVAYKDIKDRGGRMVDGVFVKDRDEAKSDWIEWTGGKRPELPSTARVEAKMRNGGKIPEHSKRGTPASNLRWGHDRGNRSYDIIAYRVISDE
jgi:hypothetical protein